MRVLLLCRRFDLQNDVRLRRLTGEHGVAEEVTVAPLPIDMVRRIIQNCDVSPDQFSLKQLQLLSNPLNLKILTVVLVEKQGLKEQIFQFGSLRDLYDEYWTIKQQTIRERLGQEPRWVDTLDALVDRMVEDQALSAPRSILDSYDVERTAMLSEGMLVQEGHRLSFFHETFFDYTFARRFVARGR